MPLQPTTIDKIYSAIKTELGNTYNVLTSYDATDDIVPTGTISVSINESEDLHHESYNDFRFGVSISGITIADSDPDRSIIHDMIDFVLNKNWSSLKLSITGCVGVVRGQLTTQSDGDSNEFTFSLDVYVCDAVFA